MSIKVKETVFLDEIEINQCLSISKKLFGYGYHSKKFFLQSNIIKIIALKNNEIVGFFTTQRINKKIIIDCIAIKYKWQKKKIGSLLTNYFFKNIVRNNEKVIAYAWKVNNKIAADKINVKFGLKKIKSLGKYWKRKCNKSFKCIQYHNSCKCECILYSN
jgi:predicted GNAT family acetyltransferase|tara:strand:- start:2057 stop:2536 length:480 start_codon:yes stop_codon:yes gene_type:complete